MLTLIEGHGLIFRSFFGLPRMVRFSDKFPVQAIQGCCAAYWRLARENPSHVAVVFDKGGSVKRRAIYPAYKATRPPVKPDLLCQIPHARRAAEAFGFRCIDMEGVEADDIIATLARMALEQGHEVTIASTDKDMTPLLGRPGVTGYDPKYHRVIDAETVERKWGVPPHQMLDLLSMCGDKADNVIGIDGIGPARGAALLKQFGTLEAILDNIDKIPPGVVQDAVRAEGHKARAAKVLITLDEHVELGLDMWDLAYSQFDTRAVLEFLDEMELVTLREEIATSMAEAA